MKRVLLRFLAIGLGAGFLGALSLTAIIVYFSFGLPKIASLADYRPRIPSKILSRDGTVLAEIGKEKREVVEFEQIPQIIIDSFISAEDSSFYEHDGVHYLGVARAMMANIKAGRVVQGGSTITQQVAKSFLLTRERSYTRKIKDFLLAKKIEERFSKKEILFLYLNQVYLGGGYYGVKSAFRGYFGKELAEATVAEASMVAGLLVAPGKYSPYINPKHAKKRQRYVLGRLYANGKITEEAYRTALDEKIKFRLRRKGHFKAGYFTDWVRQRVIELVGEEAMLNEGYTIKTTLNWDLQKVAEEQVAKGVKEIDKRQGFKGPLDNIASEEVEAYEIAFRKKLYSKASTYFTLNDELKKVYESEFDEDVYTKNKEELLKVSSEIRNRRFVAGYNKEDKALEFLDKDSSHLAIVTKVDDRARMIYVTVGGVSGIIPYSHFRWAHERDINQERKYWGYVTKPSSILKKGDKILVTIKRKSTSIISHFWKAFRPYVEKSKDFPLLKEQRYLLCQLDQEADAQGALVSIKPTSGEIISFVGGADFKKSQFNRAVQSHRQPGSAFKPLLFAAGLENGYTPSTIIIDSPEALGGVDAALNWKPRNYDGKFKGPITFRNSLEQSRNVPTIKIADKLGVSAVLDFSERIGFNAKLDQDLSLALGSFGVTLVDIVSTYAIFPNGGKLTDAKSIISITDRDGNQHEIDENIKKNKLNEKKELEEQELAELKNKEEELNKLEDTEESKKKINPYLVALGGDQVYDPRLSYLMSNILRGVVLHGTGRRAKEVSTFLAGKTGTTNNYVDAWFLGFSSNIVTGVWTGFDNNKTLGWGETGAKSALPIWKEFMRSALKKFGEYDFQQPIGIINVKIDKDTGKIANNSNKKSFLESFVEGTEPGAQKEENVEELKAEDNSQLFEEDDYYTNQ
jgi:penicillin-binding protein 1A